MMARMQVTMHSELQRRAKKRAAEMGVSVAEYVRRVVEQDLGPRRPEADVSQIFDLGHSGGSHVARDKHEMIGEAIEAYRMNRRRRR